MASLWLLPLLAVVVPPVLLIQLLPRSPILRVKEWPSLAWLIIQVIISAATKSNSKPSTKELPQIEVALTQPAPFDSARLAKFRSLVGHKALPTNEVPVMYPIAESFRLCMQAMLLPDFPLNILGSVLARNRTEVYAALHVEDKLTYRCRVAPQLRVTPKGDTEADLVSSATRQSDGKEVWKSTLTVIVLGKGRNKNAAGTAAAVPKPEPPPEMVEIDTWHLADSVGRQYGSINGDLNPIHLYPLTSRLFGFKRPIAHALFLVAKAEASLRNSGNLPAYPCVLETEFKRPTLLPAKLVMLREKAGKEMTLSWSIVTSDVPAKDVIVGKLCQG